MADEGDFREIVECKSYQFVSRLVLTEEAALKHAFPEGTPFVYDARSVRFVACTDNQGPCWIVQIDLLILGEPRG